MLSRCGLGLRLLSWWLAWRLLGGQIREHLTDVRELDAQLVVERLDLVHVRVAASVVEQFIALLVDSLRQPLRQNGASFPQNVRGAGAIVHGTLGQASSLP